MDGADPSTMVDGPLRASAPTLEGLYRRYASWLTMRLRRRFGDAAEDIVQETYLRIAPRHARGDIRHPRALLMTVANNIGKNQVRQAAYQRQCAEDESNVIAFPGGGQFDELLLKQIIQSLPEAERVVFVLSRIRGLTYLQIAAHLDIPVKTVEWRMSRALNHCAAHLRS